MQGDPVTNQWPTFHTAKTKSVRAVLLEEGVGIVDRTDGKIRFVVESEPTDDGGLLHRCFLDVAAVGYRFPLMRVRQAGLDYPATVVADIYERGKQVKTETDLRKTLGSVFKSDAVANVVPQLLELVS